MKSPASLRSDRVATFPGLGGRFHRNTHGIASAKRMPASSWFQGVGNCTGLFSPTLAAKGESFFHVPAVASNWEKPRIRPPEQCFAKVSTGFDPMVAEFSKNQLSRRALLIAEPIRHRDEHRDQHKATYSVPGLPALAARFSPLACLAKKSVPSFVRTASILSTKSEALSGRERYGPLPVSKSLRSRSRASHEAR